MAALTLTTCQAPNMEPFCRDLAAYLGQRLGMPVNCVLDVTWQEREQLLDAGRIDLGWICGLPYVRKAAAQPGMLEPLVAPVMSASRYQNRPIYFSDVVVRQDSPFQRLAELRGAAWAYNEPGSHSGYGVVRYALALRGETLAFFGKVIESGAHQTSLEMILNGEVTASAIDSTVLELELENHPEIIPQIRVIDTFGPSPMPPWVVSRAVSPELRVTLSQVLSHLQADREGQALLRKAHMTRFEAVSDQDYDPIRAMAHLAFGKDLI